MKHIMPSKSSYRAAALGFCALFAIQLGSVAAQAANIVYNVDTTVTTSDPTGNPLQTDTVIGSITTDGTIGVLGSTDIVSWNLQLIDGLNGANDFTLTTADSTLVEDTGGALSATPTQLLFNFSGSGEFLIQGTAHGAYSGWNYFCFSTGGACLAGETISPQFYTGDGVVLTGASAPVGQQPLGPAPNTGTPEPSTYTLMLTSVLGLGAALRIKRR